MENIPMGFADISIKDLAEDYSLPVSQVIQLCDQMAIPYQNEKSNLALEDAKKIILAVLELKSSPSGTV
jgi:hypothetical protein